MLIYARKDLREPGSQQSKGSLLMLVLVFVLMKARKKNEAYEVYGSNARKNKSKQKKGGKTKKKGPKNNSRP